MTWLLFIAFEILRNYALIKWLELRPHYGWSHIIRWGAGAFFFFYHYPDPATTPFPAIVYGLFQASSFYVLFDPILNILRGKPLFYQGKNSGTLDKLPKEKYYLLKAASLIVLILTLLVMYG